MSPQLFLHGRQLASIFELLGRSENSITYSIGWALSRSPGLLQAFCAHLSIPASEITEIRMQESLPGTGITDIELLGSDWHIIVEAKRGWFFPEPIQWDKYADRLRQSSKPNRAFLAMCDSSRTYAGIHLQPDWQGFHITYLSWAEVARMISRMKGTHAENRLLSELKTYLLQVATMQKFDSNMVYVVSLGRGIPEGSTISWIDVIEKQGVYFHPVGKGWPKDPPNYVAFRYFGRLQSIHHVDSFEVIEDLSVVPGMRPGKCPHHFLYQLGPAIRPPHEVKNGPSILRNSRVFIMLDLLLTSTTLTEAWAETNRRRADD